MTLGDPSGIGPEVVAKSIIHLSNHKMNIPIIIGDTKTVIETLLRREKLHMNGLK